MSELFEVERFTAKRKATGSEVRYSHAEFDHSQETFIYENQNYGLKVGFPALFVDEILPLASKKSGRVIQQPLNIGVILPQGQLKRDIQRQLGESASSPAVDDLVQDVHELLRELVLGDSVRKFYDLTSEVPVHVYEVEGRSFWNAVSAHPDTMKLRPEELSALPVTLVI